MTPLFSFQKLPFPKSLLFIIGNEFCERFSYYGMKAILVLYFKQKLHFTEDTGRCTSCPYLRDVSILNHSP